VGARKARLSPESPTSRVIAVIGKRKSKVIEQADRNDDPKAARVPEARYSYYRRCQVFRRNGEQCKAPAEKGEHICYAHAGQQAMAFRRDLERRIVLAEAVAEMRRQGKPECEMADLFMDFKGIQVTLAVMARALIAGRIDCKTAGRLVVHLQTCSKLLWAYHRGHRGHRGTQRTSTVLTTKDTKKHEGLPQISADARRLKAKTVPLIHTDNTDLKRAAEGPSFTTEARRRGEKRETPRICADERRSSNKEEQPGLRIAQTALPSAIARNTHAEDSRSVIETKVRPFPSSRAGCKDGIWQQTRAA
jgi:hypothetical protein